MSEEEVEELIAIYKDKGRLQTAKRLGNMFQSYQKVVLENTYLKKSLENAQDIYKNSHKYTSECEDKVIELKRVLKEIREKLKEHNYTLDYEPWNFYEIQGNILFDLVEIIDKGIGEDK